jgi:hypothetical protein
MGGADITRSLQLIDTEGSSQAIGLQCAGR